MEVNQDKFYVTLFSNASTEIHTLNSQTSFTNRLALPTDLGSSSHWEVGLAEITYKPPQRTIVQGAIIDVISDLNVLIYCDLVTPQLVGSEIARLLRTVVCPSQLGKHLTSLITPWSRVLLEKLIGSAASQEIPRIFGTRRFITVLTSARHLSLS